MPSVHIKLEKQHTKSTIKLVFILLPIVTLLFGFGAGLAWSLDGATTQTTQYATLGAMVLPAVSLFILTMAYYLKKFDSL